MMVRRYLLILLIACTARLAVAQTDTVGTADSTSIEALTKEMYRYYSSEETEKFTRVTERLKTAALAAGDERTFYKAWSNQAIYYFSHEGRNRGLDVAKEVRDYAEKHQSKFGLYTSTYAYATIVSSLRMYDQAEKGFREAIDYQHRFFPDESAAAPYLGLAKIYVNKKETQKVMECAEKALAEPNVIMQHQLTAYSYKCIALNQEESGDRQGFMQAYEQRQKVKAAYGHDDNFGQTVEYYHAQYKGDYERALEIVKGMRTGLDKLNLMSIAYANLGRYQEAYRWSRRYKQYADSVNNAEVQKQSFEYALQLDVVRTENEAKDLRLANQALELKHASSELQRRLALMLMLAVLGLLVISGLVFYNYRRRQQLQQLRSAYDRLEETTSEKERFESELRIARDIQMGMVPSVFPAFPDRGDIDLYAAMVPAKEVGGDLYDFFLLPDASSMLIGNDTVKGGKLYFCVGDVSGKGVPASMTMTVAVNLFRMVAKEGFPPSYVATKLNDTLSADNESGMFVTMFIGMIDLRTGRMDYCNCGHNPPVVIDRPLGPGQPQRAHFLEMEANAPIGLWPDLEYVGESIENVKNRLLVVYTDGISEAENTMQQQYGDERLLKVLSEARLPFGENAPKSHSRYVVERVKLSVDAFVGDAEQSDDITMLCIKTS